MISRRVGLDQMTLDVIGSLVTLRTLSTSLVAGMIQVWRLHLSLHHMQFWYQIQTEIRRMSKQTVKILVLRPDC